MEKGGRGGFHSGKQRQIPLNPPLPKGDSISPKYHSVKRSACLWMPVWTILKRSKDEKTARLIKGLRQVEGLEIIGEPDMDIADRGPVVTISMKGAADVWSDMPNCYIPPAFIGKALNVGWGIGTRVGYYCAHPYGYFLRKVPDDVALKHALEHAAKGRAGCGLLSGDEWIYMTRFSFSFVTPDESLQRLPGILNKIRGLSYKNSVIKPDFESGVWYVDGGQNDSRANAHSRFDLSARGPYSEWARNILKDF